MTVESTLKKVTWEGNGAATTKSFAFVIFASTDLVVTRVSADGVETVLTEGGGGSNYSVTVADYPGAGSITYPASGGSPLATGETIIIKRELPLTQLVDLENQGAYLPETQESVYDKLCMVDLQQQEELDRTVKVPIGSTTDPDGLIASLTADASAAAASAAAAAIAETNAETAETNAAASEAAAAASAAALELPDPASANAFLQRDAGNTAYELKTPAEVLAAIGAAEAATAVTLAGAQTLEDKTLAASTVFPAGLVIQRGYAEYTANADLTTLIPADNTIPQNTEGTEVLSVSITPKSATNRLRCRFGAVGGINASSALSAALFRSGAADALNATVQSIASGEVRTLNLEAEVVAGTTSAITITVRAGPASGTMRLNGNTAGRFYGGAARATLVVEEISA